VLPSRSNLLLVLGLVAADGECLFLVALGQGAINSTRGNYVKEGIKPGPKWAGPVSQGRPAQPRFGPVRPRFPPRLLLAWFPTCVHLHVGFWRRFPSRLRLESCYPSFAVFCLSPWGFACWRFSPGVIGVMFITCLDSCRASWSSSKALDEVVLKVSSLA
jgi:hypothetical protein